MVVVFAHAGHWLLNVLYLMPLLVLGGALLVGRIRDRREGREDSGPAPGSDAPPPRTPADFG